MEARCAGAEVMGILHYFVLSIISNGVSGAEKPFVSLTGYFLFVG